MQIQFGLFIFLYPTERKKTQHEDCLFTLLIHTYTFPIRIVKKPCFNFVLYVFFFRFPLVRSSTISKLNQFDILWHASKENGKNLHENMADWNLLFLFWRKKEEILRENTVVFGQWESVKINNLRKNHINTTHVTKLFQSYVAKIKKEIQLKSFLPRILTWLIVCRFFLPLRFVDIAL